MKNRLVIFDLDGTLVRSRLDFDRIRREIGLPPGPILEAIARMEGDQRGRAEAILNRHEDAAAQDSELQPGAARVVEALRRKGVGVALMTRNSRRAVRIVLDRHGLNFDQIRTREDGPFKPSPEPVLAICRVLHVQSAQTWVVGDFEYDVLSGEAAGAHTVLFLEPALPRPPWADRADHVIGDLSELLILMGVGERQ